MEMELDRLRTGERGEITEIFLEEPLKSRLAAFGLVEGTQLLVRYRSPEGGVTALELRGTVIAMRTRDLAALRVRLL